VRDALMAVDACHAVLRQRLVSAGRRRGLLRECHRGRCVAAAAFGGIVRLQLLPDLLRELQAMRFVLRRSIELATHVAPHFGVGLNVPPQPWDEFWRHVTVAATRLDAELIGVMHAAAEFLERLPHLVAGGAKRIGFREFQAADEAARKAYSNDEGKQPARGNTEQEPALRAVPEPRRKTSARRLRLRRIHFESLNASMKKCYALLRLPLCAVTYRPCEHLGLVSSGSLVPETVFGECCMSRAKETRELHRRGARAGAAGALLMSALLAACSGTTGSAGPAGPAGATGPQGSTTSGSAIDISTATSITGRITSVAIGGPPVVKFELTDQNGTPIQGLPAADLGLTIAQLVPGILLLHLAAL